MAPPWMSAVSIVMSHTASVAIKAMKSRFGADGVVLVLASDMVTGPRQGSGTGGSWSPACADLAQPLGRTHRETVPARMALELAVRPQRNGVGGQCASASSWACSATIALRQARTRARSALIPRIALPCQKRRIGFFMRFASPSALQA